MRNWLKSLFKRSVPLSEVNRYTSPGLFLPPVRAGVAVTPDSVLAIPAVYCGVRVISESIAMLPLLIYRRLPEGGKERDDEHNIYKLLHDQPNEESEAFNFFASLVANALVWGAGYAEIVRDGKGNPTGLYVVPSSHVRTLRDELGLKYMVRQPDGSETVLRSRDLLVILGFSLDGITGVPLLKLGRESLGLTIAADQFGASFLANAQRPSGFLKHPGQLSEQARENIVSGWQDMLGGSANAGKVPILEEGLEWSPMSVTPEEGQYSQLRLYQIGEVARLLNISPVFLHELGRATWSNLELLTTQLYQVTLLPWVKKIEQQINRKLFLDAEQDTYFAEHLFDAILRTDLTTRLNAYQVGRAIGIYSPNEIRAKENLNPIPGGDTYSLQVVGAAPTPTTEDDSQDEEPKENNGDPEQSGDTPAIDD